MAVNPTAPPLYSYSDFIQRTAMPADDVAIVQAKTPGKVESLIAQHQAWMYARLSKRYQTPLPVPVIEIALLWLTWMVTPDVYRARGATPGQDPQVDRFDKLADQARQEIREAADSKEGLFELPLLDTGAATAVTKGGPLAYSEQSPYAWADHQAEALQSGQSSGGDVSNPFSGS
jgi:hypothetical protein